MMKPWSAFLPDVRPASPLTPEPMLEHAIKRATQEFCRDTRAWLVELDPTLTIEGENSYDIDLDYAELVRLESAKLNGLHIDVWRAGDAPCGRYIYTPDGKTVEFSQPVAAGLPLVLRCSVTPSETARGCDDSLYDRYVTVIAKLAVATLTGDQIKRAEYEAERDRIKTRLWRGNAAIRPRAVSNFF